MSSAKWRQFCHSFDVLNNIISPRCPNGHSSHNSPKLTHWDRVMHICVSELTIIGSDNGLSPGRRQAIIWNNAGLLLIEPLGTKVSEISIRILKFSFKKMHLNMSSGKWRPFRLDLSVLRSPYSLTRALVTMAWLICCNWYLKKFPLQWRHNGHYSVSNHQPHHCLLNGLFRLKSKKTSKLCVTGLCAGNSPGTSEFPTQMASNAENVSIWWRHHVTVKVGLNVWSVGIVSRHHIILELILKFIFITAQLVSLASYEFFDLKMRSWSVSNYLLFSKFIWK